MMCLLFWRIKYDLILVGKMGVVEGGRVDGGI